MLRKLASIARREAAVKSYRVRRTGLHLERLEARHLLAAAPIISEFLAENQTGLNDGNGDQPDWIEIYNAGDEAIDLVGWHLSDNAGNLDKWTFPAQPLAAGEFLVVFASGSGIPDPEGNLHTNFQLNADGEYLALIRPDGSIAQQFSPEFPRQRPDVSFGHAVQPVDVLVASDDPAAMFVPTDDLLGLSWTGATEDEPFADAPEDEWTSVTASIGFDTGGATTTLLNVDFDTNANFTQDDFSSFLSSDSSPKTFGDFSVSVSGHQGYFARSVLPDTEDFTYGYLFRDFVYRNNGGAISFVIDGLEANTPYEITWYVYDRFGDGGGGTYTGQIAAADGSNTTGDTLTTVFDSTTAPTSNDQYAYTGTWISTDSSLEIDLSYVSHVGANYPVVRVNGFEISGLSLDDLVGTDVEAQVAEIASSAYLRIPFQVETPVEFNTLLLDLQYDDGFVAYLNGTEVARDNVPDPVEYDSVAPSDRPLSAVFDVRRFDLSDRLDLLRSGTNILAIHALNDAVDGSDFLARAELISADAVPDYYLPDMTPGGTNSFGFVDFVDDTTFDGDPNEYHGRGLYDQPFEVNLSTATPGAIIAYTTDGSEPTLANGTQVVAPDENSPPTATLLIEGTTVLRVAAFHDGFFSTNVDTQTYIFPADVAEQPILPEGFTPGDFQVDPDVVNSTLVGYGLTDALTAIPSISITTAHENLWDPSTGIYIQSGARGRAWERSVSIELIQPDGGDEFQIDAGLRMHGGISRGNGFTPKHGFRFYFRNEYGAGKLDFPLFDGNPVERFDELVLKGLSTDTWPVVEWAPTPEGYHRWLRERASYIRDQWMRDSQLAISGESADGMFVHVYLNGLYWGVYNLMERPTDSFQAAHFGGDKDEYDVVHDFVEVQAGSGDLWIEMMTLASWGLETETAYQFIQGNDPDGTPNPDLTNYLNVDSLIDYMILHIASGADDWPNHNWWAARRRGPESDGFRFFSWDQEISNNSLDRARNSWGNVLYEEVAANNTPAKLYDRLRLNSSFQVRFGDRVHALLFNGGLLSPETNRARWDVRSAEIDKAIVAESARWGDARRAEPYRREVEWLANETWQDAYWDLNHPKAVQRFRNVNLYPATDAPSLSQHGGAIPPGFPLTMSAPPGVIYFTVDGSDPMSAGASIFDGTPVTLDDNTFVRTRAKNGNEWSAVTEAHFALDTQLIRITEINYHPADATPSELALQDPLDVPFDDDDFEFMELHNTSATSVNLINFTISGDMSLTFSDIVVEEDERVLVVRNEVAFLARYGNAYQEQIIAQYGDNLPNGGGDLILADSIGAVIHEFSYDDSGQWPGRADGKGSALEVIDVEGDYDDPDNWRSSSEYGGSPGVAGVGPDNRIVINEVFTHTDDPNVDTIELLNTTGAPIDLGGWYLSDDADDFRKFQIPDGTIIAAGGYLTFDEGDFNPSGGLDPVGHPDDFSLNGAHGDDVWLLEADAEDDLVRFVDHVDFGGALNGITLGRWPNATGRLFPMQWRTLGDENGWPVVHEVMISELHYNSGETVGDDLEFVEIYNPTNETVNLTGWRLRKGVDYDFAEGLLIDPSETIVVVSFDPEISENVSRESAFRFHHGIDMEPELSSVRLVGGYRSSLCDLGEAVELQRPDAVPLSEPEFTPHAVVDRVVYDDAAPWPDVSVSNDSLHRTSIDAFGSEVSSWTPATPTPGSVDLADPTPRVVGVGIGKQVRGTSGVIDASVAGITTLDIYFNVPEPLLGLTRVLDGAAELSYEEKTSTLSYRQLELVTAATHRWLEITTGGTSPAESLFVGQLLGDLDGDQKVGAGDLAKLFGSTSPTDITGDGVTNAADLAHILAAWGDSLPAMPTGDAATVAGDASSQVIDTTIVGPTPELAAISPLPTFIAKPISGDISPRRTRREIDKVVATTALRGTARRRLPRRAVDMAMDAIEDDGVVDESFTHATRLKRLRRQK
jgi:hypothetical protein